MQSKLPFRMVWVNEWDFCGRVCMCMCMPLNKIPSVHIRIFILLCWENLFICRSAQHQCLDGNVNFSIICYSGVIFISTIYVRYIRKYLQTVFEWPVIIIKPQKIVWFEIQHHDNSKETDLFEFEPENVDICVLNVHCLRSLCFVNLIWISFGKSRN